MTVTALTTTTLKFNFASNNAPPPGNQQVRTNQTALANVTAVYVDGDTTDGHNALPDLLAVTAGDVLYLLSSVNPDRWARFVVASAPVDHTTWVEFPVTVLAAGPHEFTNAACTLTLEPAAYAFVSLHDIVEAIADQVNDAVTAADLGGEALQVWPLRVLEPTPPVIDVYPASPFSDQIAYGPNQQREVRFVVRARVAPSDTDAAQELLLQLMDDRAPTSVAAAIRGDRTLGGLVQNVAVEGPDYGDYAPTGPGGYLVGAEWLARVTR